MTNEHFSNRKQLLKRAQTASSNLLPDLAEAYFKRGDLTALNVLIRIRNKGLVIKHIKTQPNLRFKSFKDRSREKE